MAPRGISRLVRMQSLDARVARHRELSVILLAVVKPKQGFLVLRREDARIRCFVFYLQLNWIHTMDNIVANLLS